MPHCPSPLPAEVTQEHNESEADLHCRTHFKQEDYHRPKPLNPPPFLLEEGPHHYLSDASKSISTPMLPSTETAQPSIVHPVTPRAEKRHVCFDYESSHDDEGITAGLIEAGGEARDAALLLTKLAVIAKKEVNADPDTKLMDAQKSASCLSLPSMSSAESKSNFLLSPRFTQLCSVFESEYQHEKEMERQQGQLHRCNQNQPGNRVRAVSIDSHHRSSYFSSDGNTDNSSSDPFDGDDFEGYCEVPIPRRSAKIISPPNSPTAQPSSHRSSSSLSKKTFIRSLVQRRKRLDDCEADDDGACHHRGKKFKVLLVETVDKNSVDAETSHPHNDGEPLQSAKILEHHTIKRVLRKKFSWKNYPELEAFLIANREEYLRHSALNYTIQQKQYNNRLTERLLELASDHGYVFDEEAFSFVTVRDRIRCYFKSYVQSSKKRGVIIGYAARRAGLVSEEELEKSAGKMGTIVVPVADRPTANKTRHDTH